MKMMRVSISSLILFLPICYSGFWTYFWLLSAFFWLSIISFNIWYQSSHSMSQTFKEYTLWIIYLMFGFGIPTLFLLVATISHHFPNSFFVEPNMGNGVCWFQGMLETWIYFSGPMAVLLSCNLIFFILTIRLLWLHYKDTRPQPRIRTLRFKAALYFKLFLTMGLTWIFELISFTFQIDWYVSDILNSLQGPIIFTLMVLNRAKVMRSSSCTNTIYTIFFLCTKPWGEKSDEEENETQILDNIQMN